VSLCGLTAAQALFLRMGLKAPFAWNDRTEDERSVGKGAVVFIYGASTSVGMYAAQLVQAANKAHRLGIMLVGAASGKHFGYLRAEPYYYGHLVDYRSEWEGQIRQLASNGLDIAYDCISEGQTVSKIAHLTKGAGKMAIVRSRQGGAWSQDGAFPLEPAYGAVWEGLGKEVQYQGMRLPINDTARDFTVAFYKWLSEGNSLSPNPVRSMPNGLVGIKDDGLPLLGYGTMDDRGHERSEAWMRPISGEKLVYELFHAEN
jgi:NADPH:quinone reductase-like Zn-dependent oxidoreductase